MNGKRDRAVSPESVSALPADLEDVVRNLGRTEQAAWRVTLDLSEEQLNWRPNGGRAWSIVQCLDHLAKTNTAYTAALREAVRKLSAEAAPRRSAIRPGWLGRAFIRSLEPPVRRK